MKTFKADLVVNSQCELGEGPVWLDRQQRLFWVDILGKSLHTWSPATNQYHKTLLPVMPGAAAPIQGSDELLVATESSLLRFHPLEEHVQRLAGFPESDIHVRANDGKCGPSGKFWIGSMDVAVEEGRGNLFRIASDLSDQIVLDTLTIPNGLAWNQEGNRMYFIDSPSREIKVFEFEAEVGKQGELLKRIPFPVEWGIPDGMTIDQNDHLWIACWGGFAVVCVDPDSGTLLATVELPVPHVTSCTFGGKTLDTLYITTARDRENLSGLAGAVFACHPGVAGMIPHSFHMT